MYKGSNWVKTESYPPLSFLMITKTPFSTCRIGQENNDLSEEFLIPSTISEANRLCASTAKFLSNISERNFSHLLL